MPYIEKKRRKEIEEKLFVDGVLPVLNSAGELNYFVTLLAINYLEDRGLNYQSMNDVFGALEGAKLEFYRRVVVPYEDAKARENGDLYGNHSD
jgi:hypothetical protein